MVVFNLNTAFGLALCFIVMMSGCVSSNVNQSSSKAQVESNRSIYPVVIEFGAIGKGSSRPLSIVVVDTNVVQIMRLINATEVDTFFVPIQQTKFKNILNKYVMFDFQGDKTYTNGAIRDGGYVTISNHKGSRKFINVFRHLDNPKWIKPDTIGLNKYKELVDYTYVVLR